MEGLKYNCLVGFSPCKQIYPFFSKLGISLSLVSSRSLQNMLRIFWELREGTQLPITPSGLLAIVLSCMCAFCEVGFFGSEVCVSLFIFLCMLMEETEGRRWVSVTSGCSCLDLLLPVMGFFPSLLCLKLEVILWMQDSTGMSPEKKTSDLAKNWPVEKCWRRLSLCYS